MSATLDAPGPEALAAEYALGTLEADDLQAARLRLTTDAAFAADVQRWENLLYPLTLLIPPVPPPATLWPRIEDSTGGALQREPARPPRAINDNALGRWRAAALVALAVAAGLAAFIALRPPPQPVLAILTPAPVLVAVRLPHGSILLRPTSPILLKPDRDLELWALAVGATRPVSLGVIPASGTLVPPGIRPGTALLVSLEPKGGSPTGQPTGPVVYSGTLKRFE